MKQKLPQPDRTSSSELIDQTVQGDFDARNKLISQNVRLVLKIAHKFIPKHRGLADEIEEVAIRSLIERLEKIRTGEIQLRDHNIGALINRTTVFRIQDFLKQALKDVANHASLQEAWKESSTPVVHNNALYNILREEILASPVFCEQERIYLQLKFDGYTDVEAADIMKRSKSNISRIKKNIAPKIKEFL